MFYSCKSQFQEKYLILPFEKIPFLSLTRGSKYSDFTWKLLVFWKTGRLQEVVATRGSTVINANEYMKDELGY